MFFHLSNCPSDPVPEDEDLLPPCPRPHSHARICEARHRKRELALVINTFLLTSLGYLFVVAMIALTMRESVGVEATDEACMRHVQQYSPLVEEVEPKWHTVRFNGSLLRENVYRQSAGPEVDAAWEALGVDYRPIIIPLEDAEKAGLRADQVKVQSVFGGGFIANVEALHHLHCLNILRKSLQWNYDYYLAEGKPPFTNNEEIVRIHVTHCLDMIRQQLMCVPDVGVLGQVWWQAEVQKQPEPFVDFNTVHRCRDFDGVRAWAKEHQVSRSEDVDMGRFYKWPEAGDTIYSEIP